MLPYHYCAGPTVTANEKSDLIPQTRMIFKIKGLGTPRRSMAVPDPDPRMGKWVTLHVSFADNSFNSSASMSTLAKVTFGFPLKVKIAKLKPVSIVSPHVKHIEG